MTTVKDAVADLDRAHGFLRGRRMPLNMDENEAIHKDLAEQFRQAREEGLEMAARHVETVWSATPGRDLLAAEIRRLG